MIDVLGLNNSIGTMVAAHNFKYSRSTQEKGMVRRSNPYSPPPWEQNRGISKMTDMFADAIPTLGEVTQASMMMTTPNPFAIRYGQQANNSFGHVLMQVRAMNQQRDNQLSQLLMDQQKHEFMKQKFEYQQHKDAFDIIREQSQNMRDTVGEAYRELMGILPKLDNASANRLMQGIIDDPTPLESLESPSDVWRFMATKMADAGLKWKETKKGREFGADVQPATDKIDRQSTVAGTFVLPDGRETKVATRTYEDGRTVTVDVLTGEIIPPETMRHATIKEKESELSIFTRQLRDMQSGATSEPVSREVAEGVRQERAASRKAPTPASPAASAVPEGVQKPEVTTGRPPPPWNDPDTKNKKEPAKKSLLPSKERRKEASRRSTSAWDDLRTRTQEWWGSVFK